MTLLLLDLPAAQVHHLATLPVAAPVILQVAVLLLPQVLLHLVDQVCHPRAAPATLLLVVLLPVPVILLLNLLVQVPACLLVGNQVSHPVMLLVALQVNLLLVASIPVLLLVTVQH